jgi:hypothetical protein
MAKKVDIDLHSDYSPETCLAKLQEQIDVDQRTLFSFSGYKGKKPIVGRIAGNEFRLHKRRYWHNSFGPVLFGRMTTDGRGTLIEAYWEMWKSVRIFMRIWLGLVVLFSAPIFPSALRCAMGGKCMVQGDYWVGVIVPPAMILFGILLPQFGSALGFHERKHIVELLERTLVAGSAAIQNRERNWDSSLDNFRLGYEREKEADK